MPARVLEISKVVGSKVRTQKSLATKLCSRLVEAIRHQLEKELAGQGESCESVTAIARKVGIILIIVSINFLLFRSPGYECRDKVTRVGGYKGN